MLNDRIRIRKPSKMTLSIDKTKTHKLKSSVNIKDMTASINRNSTPALNQGFEQT